MNSNQSLQSVMQEVYNNACSQINDAQKVINEVASSSTPEDVDDITKGRVGKVGTPVTGLAAVAFTRIAFGWNMAGKKLVITVVESGEGEVTIRIGVAVLYMVEVTATGGPQSTMLQRTGYDNRTPAGAGSIQLVSPALTRWQNVHSDYYTGSIATLKLQLVPEPEAWLMLVSGIGALTVLYRVNGQRGRA